MNENEMEIKAKECNDKQQEIRLFNKLYKKILKEHIKIDKEFKIITHREIAFYFNYSNSRAFKIGVPFKDCVIHHIDETNLDFSENLYICSSAKEHQGLHKHQRDNKMKFKTRQEIDKHLSIVSSETKR